MTTTSPSSFPPGDQDGLVEIDGSGYYAIHDIDRMHPFLMSVVSDGDRWMFISSTGGLTAGRVDASGALFPYQTDDALHHAAGVIGPVTAVRVVSGGHRVWTPLRGRSEPGATRRLFKSVVGNTVIFEEENSTLQLLFRYRWTSSDRFGFVRTATLVNLSDVAVSVSLIDGLLGVLPHGLDPSVYQSMGNLTNAYKRSEVVGGAPRMAAYTLESKIVDRPEPAEVLRASVVWSAGFSHADLTLTPDALDGFEAGGRSEVVELLTGRPGAYLLTGTLELGPEAEAGWHIVADVGRDQRQVAALRAYLRAGTGICADVEASVAAAATSLVEIMAPADALQWTGDRVATAHQFANVTYNVMRGGVPLSGYRIATADIARFIADRSKPVAERHRSWLEALPSHVERSTLLAQAAATEDAQLTRLAFEYLPFSFSRRHGDPSRPWNRFSIRLRDAAGEPLVYYEGNWRDIFQNWEALCLSFPEYLPGVISVFVDASTPDGFNPYRITRAGVDWEVPEPDDPWSNIGYWGDHQIVYLLRLLQAAHRFVPGRVERMLGERRFSYADVPYRIAPYEALVRDPKQTISYDFAAAEGIAARVEAIGSDGKLVQGTDGAVYLATLAEKLLIPALTKLSNYVPGGGIWMNTQRPEWNDANNALVGYGLSMVTLYHLRRYLDHLRRLVAEAECETVQVSTEVSQWFAAVLGALESSAGHNAASDDSLRRALMDRLGHAFSEYRARVYAEGFSGRETLNMTDVVHLCDIAIEHLDDTIRRGRRSDGLYESYNLVHFGTEGSTATIEPLGEMLEGQVAVLDSGVLSPTQRADVVDALFASAMYRADLDSFMLYPARRPPTFLDKNVVPAALAEGNPLLWALIEEGDASIITVDVDGVYRFNPDLSDQGKLSAALEGLDASTRWSGLVRDHRAEVLTIYEHVFRHRAYTGRSGSMYGYEGIGSIYWHMVAKLLVAVQESVVDASAEGAPSHEVARLIEQYWRVRAGLGFNKTAREFGAIPIDPYSHSPAHAGAQQPGMTGLVKEELLTRPLELAVRVDAGSIEFDRILLRGLELLSRPESWALYDADLRPLALEVPAGSLGVTICQVPVIVSTTSGDPEIEILRRDGSTDRIAGVRIDAATSAQVFGRTGEIHLIRVSVPMPAPATNGEQ